MRIERLYMKNFSPIFIALNKNEVELDYTQHEDKVINIFIGEMGSCKTFLLGHHQPFASLGNLDVRNSEDMVIVDLKGIKEITYRNGDTIYEIRHVYSPTSTGHSVKSYIKKNGVELNENGNGSSFREIILTEFGLDQGFLKLFRIGSNVTNLPDMSSTERKSFISSMISDTEIYAFLYRKIGEENRTVNAQMTLLINKLHTISKRPEEDLATDMESETVICNDLQAKIDKLTEHSYRVDAQIQALRNGKSQDDYLQMYQDLLDHQSALQSELSQIAADLDAIKDYPSIDSINKEMITIQTQIGMRQKQIMSIQIKLDEDETKRNQLQDRLAILGSPDHVDTLRQTYDGLMKTLDDYEKQIRGFQYDGSMGTVMTLLSEAANLNTLILDVSQYNADAIRALLKNSKGTLNSAKRQLQRKYQERDRIQMEMSNIMASASYESTHIMVRPFNCPTADCPFYKYHPYTEKRNLPKNVDATYLEQQNRKTKLDAEIFLLEDYPNIARKLDIVTDLWKHTAPSLKALGCLKEEDLADVITNLMHRNWYDIAKLNRVKELCGIREQYYALMQEVAAMRNNLTQYEVSDAHQVQKELDEINEIYQSDCAQMEALTKETEADKERLQKLTDVHEKVLNMQSLQTRQREASEEECQASETITRIQKNLVTIDQFVKESEHVKQELTDAKAEYSVHHKSYNNLYLALRDLQLTKTQYAETLKRQELIRDILDAVSSKKGIPLAFVRVFLEDCKDTINDLIADVFDDDIEIVDFDIPEDSNEFKIPYTRNGALIDDIVKSSQGERAIISLALSFALIRQRTFPYNIMLLDEVDGPLHRSARNKFITILFKQLHAINAEQVFLVSHNNTFDGYNVNVIMTTDEIIDENPLTTVMKV